MKCCILYLHIYSTNLDDVPTDGVKRNQAMNRDTSNKQCIYLPTLDKYEHYCTIANICSHFNDKIVLQLLTCSHTVAKIFFIFLKLFIYYFCNRFSEENNQNIIRTGSFNLRYCNIY